MKAMPAKSKLENLLCPKLEHFDADESGFNTPQTGSPSFTPAYKDTEFLLRDELRPVRLQLELLKPELLQQEYGITSTVVVFGSTRIQSPESAKEALRVAQVELKNDPTAQQLRNNVEQAKQIVDKSHYYEMAREFGRLVSREAQNGGAPASVIITGGGGGIMEAANRGAHDVGAKSIGLNIVLPKEQHPNAYITPELCFQFQYFALRKMHFLLRAIALVVFPGGYGTLDELFETLTLIQTKKSESLPVLLFGREYWQRIINFEALVEEGAIDQADYELFQYVESPEEAWDVVRKFYSGERS
ncbi:MAG: hypothetical protein ACI8XU_000318 [Kiritimatiellia bacterium]|jgi:uncharacterized protein (TIGR00730 family)